MLNAAFVALAAFLVYIIAFNLFQKRKYGTLDWKKQIEIDFENEVAAYHKISEENLIQKIDISGKKDNTAVYLVLREKGSMQSLVWLIQTYQVSTIKNNPSLNKYHFLLTIDIIATRLNFELPENIKHAVSSNNPTEDYN